MTSTHCRGPGGWLGESVDFRGSFNTFTRVESEIDNEGLEYHFAAYRGSRLKVYEGFEW